MSFEYLIDPEQGPQWTGLLPGTPAPYVLRRGEGEHAQLFTDLFTVLLSGDETQGQFGVITSESPGGRHHPHPLAQRAPTRRSTCSRARCGSSTRTAGAPGRPSCLGAGDFGFVPAGFAHAYRIEEAARMLGVVTGGFERFFQHMGTPSDHADAGRPPFVPDFPRMQAAAQQHDMQFLQDFEWPDA